MRKSSRLYNSLINVGTTALVTIFSMILSMVVRSFLNRTLGTDYVGLNGVLTSVISSLAITDLGVDSVFIYLLYRPISEHDKDEIDKLMFLFKRVYLWIGTIFLLLGIGCIPLLQYIVGSQAMMIPHLRLIFFIFVLNTGLSYFFAAYRIILNADQKYYYIARVTFFVTVLTNVIQIIGLLTLRSFIVYSLLLLISTIVINLIIGGISIKKYRLKKLSTKKISEINFKNDQTISTLIHNTIGGISNKLGIIFVNSSNNILLANFATLNIVGMYSNYVLVTNGVTSLLSKVIASITASVGNLGAEGNQQKNLLTFIKLSDLMNWLVILAVIPMTLFFGVFVNLWVGSDNILPELATILIVVNCLLNVMRYPALTFIDAFGLQWIQRWKSIIESIVNIGVALVLLYYFDMGLVGVLLGTLASNLLVVNWYEPYLVLREACGKQFKPYLKEIFSAVLLFILVVIYSAIILKSGVIGTSVVKSLGIICLSEVGLIVIMVILFRNSAGMKFIGGILSKILRRKEG